MTPEEQNLCRDLVLTPQARKPHISNEEFLVRFSSAVQDSKLAVWLIEKAYEERNAKDLRCALIVGGAFGFTSGHTNILCNLLAADWHYCHEEIVGALQDLRDPAAVDALERTVQTHYDYLNYDELSGLARKCTWALADIGSAEARQALSRLAASDDSLVASYARKRLENWQKELDRKAAADVEL